MTRGEVYDRAQAARLELEDVQRRWRDLRKVLDAAEMDEGARSTALRLMDATKEPLANARARVGELVALSSPPARPDVDAERDREDFELVCGR